MRGAQCKYTVERKHYDTIAPTAATIIIICLCLLTVSLYDNSLLFYGTNSIKEFLNVIRELFFPKMGK